MDSQRRFEGPDLEALLTQVQQECGEAATILEANKLRTGGVGGFFARERFEVIVALPEDAAEPASTTMPASAPTDALQSAINASATKPGPRRITTTPKIWSGNSASETTTPTTPTESPAARATSHLEDAVMAAIAAADAGTDEVATPAAPTSILELAEQRNNEERSLTASPEPDVAPSVSTETPAFAEMLGQLARDALREQDEEFVPLATEAATVTTAAPVVAEPVVPAVPAAPVMVAPAATPAPVAAPVAPTQTVEPVPARPAAQSPVAAALACLGMPDHLLPTTHALSELRTDLVAALRWLPAADPLPTTSGSVIAVVGNADHAMAMAQQVAQELGCDEREIVVAGELGDDTPSWMQLRDLAEATERRRSWRRRTTPTVVAVAAPLGYDPAAWARPMLDALEPTIAWGVVSADRKAEDVRAWIDRLGGVDAIALTDTTLTVSPATMLQLGIPIARLDGDRADPIRWANLLLGRLAA